MLLRWGYLVYASSLYVDNMTSLLLLGRIPTQGGGGEGNDVNIQ